VLVLREYLNPSLFQSLQGVIGVIMIVAVSGAFANVLVLGIDQLVDASSSEISSYINTMRLRHCYF